MYKVLDLLLTNKDFNTLRRITKKYESGKISLKDFKKIADKIMLKYGRRPSDIWRYEYAILQGKFKEIKARRPSFRLPGRKPTKPKIPKKPPTRPPTPPKAPTRPTSSSPRLLRTILRFKRPIRTPGDWKHYNYHPIQVTVFTIGKDWTKRDIEAISRQIIEELPANWNKLGGGVTFDEEHSIVSPEELTPKDGFTWQKYIDLVKYLRQYDDVARNPNNWHDYIPPENFRNEKHILSHYIVCGLEENREVTAEYDLLDLIMVECPCEEGTDFPVSESLTVYAGNNTDQYCILWKKSGWRINGAKYIPPKSGFPGYRPPGRPRKKPVSGGEGTSTVRVTNWLNPMKHYNIYYADRKFWDTLLICKKYGLNPIPLRPNSKLPAIEWKYLKTEPIKPEHFKLFKNPDYNIGIMAGYGNTMIVDIDVPLKISINTLTDKTPRGYHYYFKVDKVTGNRAFVMNSGKCKGKSPLGIKGAGYVVAPPSVVNGKKYEWVYTGSIMRVKGTSLVKVFEDFFNKYYDKIAELFRPVCNANEEGYK